MQLSEIKNDLATINYSPAINRLLLSDFVLIEDSNQSILAQIISIEATMEEDVNSAMLKFLLSIDKDANLTQYSGYVPAKNASIIMINPEEVIQLIKGNDKNIQLGSLAAYKDVSVDLSLDFLRKKTYVQVDFVENKLQIVKTIINALEKNNKKALLFDFQGLYESLSLPTVILGTNFKLPLNYDALCYIAEEELNEFDNANKAIIQGILIEVQNYVKTTPDEFIPFDTFISVLDAQYEETPVPELLLLKNKLLKYQQQGIFAQEKSEFDFLDTFLKDTKNFKFDLSELPSQWHKIAFISILNIIKTKCYLITDFNEDNSNKTIIKRLYEKSEIKPIVLSSYDYKYQLQLKAMSKNLILFKPVQKVDDFAGYTSFLNILSYDTFIVWGEQTLFIPLILKIKSKNTLDSKLSENIIKHVEKDVSMAQETANQEQLLNEDNSSDIPSVDSETNDIILSDENNLDNYSNEEPTLEDSILEDISEQYEIGEENNDSETTENSVELINDNAQEDFDVLPENDDPNSDDLDFFFEEGNEISESDMQNDNYSEEADADDSESIVEDFDNININDDLETQSQNYEKNAEISSEPDNSEIIDSITVFDDNKNNEEEAEDNSEVTEDNDSALPVVEIKKPSVPVYSNTDVTPQFDTKFAQGTYVYHQKYGRGVVEKVITHGSKELCFIIFDSVGRRCLDPNLADLKQV